MSLKLEPQFRSTFNLVSAPEMAEVVFFVTEALYVSVLPGGAMDLANDQRSAWLWPVARLSFRRRAAVDRGPKIACDSMTVTSCGGSALGASSTWEKPDGAVPATGLNAEGWFAVTQGAASAAVHGVGRFARAKLLGDQHVIQTSCRPALQVAWPDATGFEYTSNPQVSFSHPTCIGHISNELPLGSAHCDIAPERFDHTKALNVH